MTDFLPKFEDYLYYKKNVSANTLQSYVRDIRGYENYWDTCGVRVGDVTESGLEQYIQHMEDDGRSKATILRNVASIRCYYQFLLTQGLVRNNPAKDIKLDKEEKKLPMILSENEIELLLQQPNPDEIKGCRDKAMLELLYATGIRVTELIDLNTEDINLRQGMLFCRNGKNERSIPIYYEAVRAVSDYMIKVRSAMEIDSASGHALFVNLNGRRLTRQGFWKIIKSYAEKANISKEITPHTLRHSFALHLLQNGAELRDIKEMLGHADISSTQVYVEMMSGHCQQVYHDCHPRAKAR